MQEKKFNFTKTALQNLPLPPKGKRAWYYDTNTRSLALMVTATGSKSFYVYRRVDGKPDQINLGPFPDLSVEQARKKAELINGQIANGENPNSKKREIKATPTFSEVFIEYIDKYAKNRKKSWKYDQQQFDRYLTKWGNLKITSITRDDVEEIHTQLGQLKSSKARNGGKVTANRLLALISKVFNYAIAKGYAKENPTIGIEKFKEMPRKRRLKDNELPAFFKSLREEADDNIRDFVLLTLFTAARKSEVLKMRWEHIDLDEMTWFIPETKNGEPDTKALSQFAVEILAERKAVTTSDYVFPGKGNKDHLKEPKRGWARILERAAITDLRLHDLRRTLASYASQIGADQFILQTMLNHKSISSTKIYVNHSHEPVREKFHSAIEDILAKALKASEPE